MQDFQLGKHQKMSGCLDPLEELELSSHLLAAKRGAEVKGRTGKQKGSEMGMEGKPKGDK